MSIYQLSHTQSSHHLSSANSAASTPCSPSPIKTETLAVPSSLTSTLSDDLHEPTLFASLLLNRGQVYGDHTIAPLEPEIDAQHFFSGGSWRNNLPVPSGGALIKPCIPPEYIDSRSYLEDLYLMAAPPKRGRRPGRPAKQALTNRDQPVKRKYTPTVSAINGAKRMKIQAKDLQMLNREEQKEDESDKMTTAEVEIIEIAEPEIIEIHDGNSGAEDDVKPRCRPTGYTSMTKQTVAPCDDQAREIQRLREELEAAKAVSAAANATSETARTEREMMRALVQAKDEQIAVMKEQSDSQTKERVSLQDKLEAEHATLSDLAEKYGNVKADHALVVAELRHYEARSKALQETQFVSDKEHAGAFQNLVSRLFDITGSESNPSMQHFQTSSTPQSQSKAYTVTTPTTVRPIPAPSISPFRSTVSVEEQKVDNIRKTYTKIKRRFDNLHSVAVKLSTCTKTMDLGSFGEFGHYVRQLRVALDEDGIEK